jgi:glyoxylase-like metal-dependent hydrolase (beta-lactamase superfamily II)
MAGAVETFMAGEIPFDRNFKAVPGVAEEVAPGVRRVLAPNPSAFTFTGTCSYIVGEGSVAIIDPGPDDPAHIAALLDAVRGESVAQIVLTHTHRDHTAAVPALQQKTGATIYGEGRHRAGRPLHDGEPVPLDAGGDFEFEPDVQVRDGETIEGPGFRLEAVATPGHTANHLAFALQGTDILFSGDHVMAWSTSIVAPPDGSMRDYMQSLEKLLARPESLYFPGHGPAAQDAHALVERYIAHRGARETAILRKLERGESSVPELVQAIYIGLDPKLTKAAAMTMLAHLEHLVDRGLVETDGPPSLGGTFRLSR